MDAFLLLTLEETRQIKSVFSFFFFFVLQHHQPEVLGPLRANHLQDATASQRPLHWISFPKPASVPDRGCDVPPTILEIMAACCFPFNLAYMYLSIFPSPRSQRQCPHRIQE